MADYVLLQRFAGAIGGGQFVHLNPGDIISDASHNIDGLRAAGAALIDYTSDMEGPIRAFKSAIESASNPESILSYFTSRGVLTELPIEGYDEVTSKSTVSATLEDIPDLSIELNVPTGIIRQFVIKSVLTIQCSSSGTPAIGGWAINTDGNDGTEMLRFLSGVNDTGSLTVQNRLCCDQPGIHTIKGRHRRDSGSATVYTDVAQLSVIVI